MKRHAQLEAGKVYRNRGGGEYRCLYQMLANKDNYTMRNEASGWTFEACTITMYEDGSIEWDYSKNGRFD